MSKESTDAKTDNVRIKGCAVYIQLTQFGILNMLKV